MERDKILIIYTNYSTFVEHDFKMLQKHYKIDKYHFKTSKNIFSLSKSILKEFIYLLFYGRKYKKFIIWFADYHSFLPVIFSKLFKKKSLLIVGGYDVTGIPQIKYGIHYSNKIRKSFNKFSIKYADFLLPVDNSLILNKNNYAHKVLLPVGIKSIVKNPKGKIFELPTGYNPDFWKRDTRISKKNSVMCIAGIKDERTWVLKGGDLLVEVARITPQVDFYFYGVNNSFIDKLKNIPKNFHLHGYIDNKKLPQIYSQHKVYAQFSLSEGLPNVLCEAMLCECIPVGSNVNGIPNAIGNMDFILNKKNISDAQVLILNALKSKDSVGKQFRNRIIEKFNEQKRLSTLLKIINS